LQRHPCPICNEPSPELLDHREAVPIAQNLMFHIRGEALACPAGTLTMVRCMTCGFSWNAAFDPDLLRYGADYENNQSLSPTFEHHLDDVAALIRLSAGERNDLVVVEVGCGQGNFLHRLAEGLAGRISTLVGFDPAFRGDSPLPPGARVEAEYFNAGTSHRLGVQPDIVVARHVIEHIADPLAFLRALREVSPPGTLLFVETPTIQWILDGAVAHDLHYEHCSVFDAASLRLAMELAGFEVSGVRHMLEGQYLLAAACARESVRPTSRGDRPDNRDYAARRAGFVGHWREELRQDVAAGHRPALWGAASKGVTLALLLDGSVGDLAAAIDINPARQGTFMPMTGVPVVSPETARAAGISKAYVMNPAYHGEIENYCRGVGWDVILQAVE
jgi:hypothetical protein